MKRNYIYCMDNVIGLQKHVPSECIDLTVTSPPYDQLRTYEGFSFDFLSLSKELYRVTKPGGVVVWIVADQTIQGTETGTSFRQALGFKEIGFLLHDTMIFKKRNPAPCIHRRYQPSFEFMFVMSKGKPKTFNALKEPANYGGKQFHGMKRLMDGKLVRYKGKGQPIKAMKVRHNVWEYSVGGYHSSKDKVAFEHPAIFPEQLVHDHIISWSNSGDIVLDPFMGGGTTAKIALLKGRRYIGFEISGKYVEIAKTRLRQLKKR